MSRSYIDLFAYFRNKATPRPDLELEPLVSIRRPVENTRDGSRQQFEQKDPKWLDEAEATHDAREVTGSQCGFQTLRSAQIKNIH
jgi:hypothetical protein